MTSRVRVQVASGFAAHGLTAAANLAVVPAYLVYLGPESLGLVGFLAALQVLVGVTDFGLGPVVNRELARATAENDIAPAVGLLKAVEVAYGCAALVIGTSVWGGARWLVASWLPIGGLDHDVAVRAIRFGGVAIATQFLAMLYITALRGLGYHVAANSIHALSQVLRLLGALAVVAFVWRSVDAVLAWQAVVGLSVVIAVRWGLWRQIGPSLSERGPDWSSLRERARLAADLTVVLATWPLISQVDRVVVSRALGLAALGFYVTAGTAALAVTIVTLPISNVFTPLLSKLAAGDRQRFSEAYHLAAQATTVATSAVALSLLFMPQLVLWSWTGSREVVDEASVVLQILALGALVNSLIVTPFAAQVAVGRVKAVVLTNVALVASVGPALWAMTTHFGLPGAAWVWPAVNLVHVVVQAATVERRILPGEWLSWLTRDVLLPVTGAAVAVALVAGFAASLEVQEVNRATSMVILGLGVSGGLVGSAVLARDIRPRILRMRP